MSMLVSKHRNNAVVAFADALFATLRKIVVSVSETS
jgi:hypothetical protein